MTTNTGSQQLIELGYTALEADIYLHLLQKSPLTGYRIASDLGKAAAEARARHEPCSAPGLDEGSGDVDRGQGQAVRPGFGRHFGRSCSQPVSHPTVMRRSAHPATGPRTDSTEVESRQRARLQQYWAEFHVGSILNEAYDSLVEGCAESSF